jgi:hypothetical protein
MIRFAQRCTLNRLMHRIGRRGWEAAAVAGSCPMSPFWGEHACADRGQDLVERESACSECMSGKEIVHREGMNDGREDVYLCRG